MILPAHVHEPYFDAAVPTARLINADAYSVMGSLDDNSFDLALVDPPYGAYSISQVKIDPVAKLPGSGGKWNIAAHEWDDLTQSEIFTSTLQWLKDLKRLVKPTGSIWINSTYHNGGFVNVGCQLLGLEIINEVVWYKRNSVPNLSCRRLTASHESLLWVHTGGKKRSYQFNYEDIKRKSYVYDSLKIADRQLRTVWDIPNNKDSNELAFGRHPTQKPMRLAERLLAIAGKKGGACLVPFLGSGTEALAAMKYGMNVVGIELSKDYVEIAKRRIASEFPNL